MITRRGLFQSGLLAFCARLLPGKSKANDVRPDIKCGDRLQIIGLHLHDGLDDLFEGVVYEITIRESFHGTELMLYNLISIEAFPPRGNRSWTYPGYGNHAGIHFHKGRWTHGVFSHPLNVKKVGHIAWFWDQNGNMRFTNPPFDE